MKYLIIISTALLLMGCGQEAAPTSYYFPNGFKGEFVIVYGQKNGCPKQYAKGRRQLFIPDNGVLVTQFEFSGGFRNDLFFIQNEQGEYNPVKEFTSPPKEVRGNGWKMDTVQYTMDSTIRSVRRGTCSEIYNSEKETFVVETGALMNEEGSDASALTGNVLSDSVFRQIETDSLTIHCK